MTPEERAHEAVIALVGARAVSTDPDQTRARVARAIREAVLAEREACARLVEGSPVQTKWEVRMGCEADDGGATLEVAARAIRGRGE